MINFLCWLRFETFEKDERQVTSIKEKAYDEEADKDSRSLALRLAIQ
jgi:hypothetical protein